jgi:hypothetical protein
VTLVAWHVTDDYAEVLTDTLAYGAGEAELAHVSKVTTFPHVDMLTAGKGPEELGAFWNAEVALDTVDPGGGVDRLRDLAMVGLPVIWNGLDRVTGRRGGGMIWHFGWSASQLRFVGDKFEISNDSELRHEHLSGFSSSPALASPPPPPVSDADWIRFVEAVYAEHSYVLAENTMIGGDLILTRLERGSITQRRIHSLPDDDWRFRRMMCGTVHRQGQLGPCVCGSGQPFIVCCLTTRFSPDWLCPCETGPKFVDCHRVDLDIAVLRELRRRPEEFWDTQAELRAGWAKVFPDEVPEPLAHVIPPPPPGYTPTPLPVQRPLPVVRSQNRNEPCICGSGRKYKRCHGQPRVAVSP